MKDNLGSNSSQDLTLEACGWIAQLETGDLTSEDLLAFKEWMGRSPAHRKAIRRLAHLSNDMNVLTEMAEPLKNAAKAYRSIKGNTRRWFKMPHAIGVSLVALMMFSILFFVNQTGYVENTPLMIATEVGVHREFKLSDGSTVMLNTNSELEVDFNAERRKVRLLKGEAYFQVAHNAKRPFIVYTGNQSVRAVGTAFLVRNIMKKIEVAVTEGRIEFTSPSVLTKNVSLNAQHDSSYPSENLTSKVYLDAGEYLVSQRNTPKEVESISIAELQRKLSWRNGMLDFSNTPLSEVIEDLNRYSSLNIVIADSELNNLKFGGMFRVNEMNSLFEALETTFNINVNYDKNSIHLSKHD